MASIELYLFNKNRVEAILKGPQRRLWKVYSQKYAMYGELEPTEFIGPWVKLVFPQGIPPRPEEVMEEVQEEIADAVENAFDAALDAVGEVLEAVVD